MNIRELKAIASQQGIVGYGRMTKNELEVALEGKQPLDDDARASPQADDAKTMDELFEQSTQKLIESVREQQAKAGRYKLTTKNAVYREVVLSDHQIPFQDDLAIEVSFELMRLYRPHLIYLLGDVLDNYAVSRWLTDPTRQCHRMERELTRDYLQRLRREFPDAEIVWHMGNHELRFQSLVMKNAPALTDLLRDELSFDTMFGLKELGIKAAYKPAVIGKLYHIHGHENYCRGQVVHTALRNLRWLKRSSICGHWHTFQTFWDKEVDGSIKVSHVNGCLFDSSKMPGGGYSLIDTGQRGITLINYDADGHFALRPLPFVESSKSRGFEVFFEERFLAFS